MPRLSIEYNKHKELLTVVVPPKDSKLPPEIITMTAKTGGWFYDNTTIIARGLPAGRWLITEDPSGRRGYFGLFYQDGKTNDQFLHGKEWRNGIRFGYHPGDGSHGCIMAMPADLGSNESKAEAKAKWARIQELIRATPPTNVKYQNNSDPHRRDNNFYYIRAYFDLIVKEL